MRSILEPQESSKSQSSLGRGFPGKMIQFDEHMFQRCSRWVEFEMFFGEKNAILLRTNIIILPAGTYDVPIPFPLQWDMRLVFLECTLPQTNIALENQWLEDEISFWDGQFSGAMLVSWSVSRLCCVIFPDVLCLQFPKTTKNNIHTWKKFNVDCGLLSGGHYSFIPTQWHAWDWTGVFTYMFCIKIRHSMWVNNINPTWIL